MFNVGTYCKPAEYVFSLKQLQNWLSLKSVKSLLQDERFIYNCLVSESPNHENIF